MACIPKSSQKFKRNFKYWVVLYQPLLRIYWLLLTAVDKFEIGISSIETERTPHRRAVRRRHRRRHRRRTSSPVSLRAAKGWRLKAAIPIMICVAIVFTIAFIVIVGGIFGIFWGMHETEENRAMVVSSSGRVKGSSSAIYTINQITWICSKMQHCATCLQIFIDHIVISQNWTLIEKVKHFLILKSSYAKEQKKERNFWNGLLS